VFKIRGGGRRRAGRGDEGPTIANTDLQYLMSSGPKPYVILEIDVRDMGRREEGGEGGEGPMIANTDLRNVMSSGP